jgi:hypothetical protein
VVALALAGWLYSAAWQWYPAVHAEHRNLARPALVREHAGALLRPPAPNPASPATARTLPRPLR